MCSCFQKIYNPPTDSRNFNNIFPVNPSQTTTSKLPDSTSLPSQLPPKSKLFSEDNNSNVFKAVKGAFQKSQKALSSQSSHLILEPEANKKREQQEKEENYG